MWDDAADMKGQRKWEVLDVTGKVNINKLYGTIVSGRRKPI